MDARIPHLFVVEDDPAMRQMLCDYLVKQDMSVTAMSTAEEFLRRMHRQRPDLVVLDVSLPGESGLQTCQRLRAEGDRIPIILLTARTEEVDRVLGLEMGADDYLGKPFSSRELLARIRAVLRRTTHIPGAPLNGGKDIRFGAINFQTATRMLIWENGREQALGMAEFSMLAELANNPRIPISRERLLAVSHGTASAFLPRTVDVTVMRLRKLVEPDPAEPRYLQTARGHGYMFVPDR